MKNHSHLPLVAALAATASLASAQRATLPESTAPARTPEAVDNSVVLPPSTWTGGAPDGASLGPVRPATPLPAERVDAPLAAESGAAPANLRPTSRHDRILHDVDGSTYWSRARGYKVSADADGFQFFPFLGSKASRNWPVGFTLTDATVGGSELPLRPSADVSLQGDTYVLDRGSVEVAYELGLDAAEQLFYVESEGFSGELVLTLELDTDLSAAPAGGGFRFSGVDGGVDYGAAVAFDERGTRVDVESRLDGSTLQLIVPASFVDVAVGDITVDPLVSSWSTADPTLDQSDVDVAYDNENDAFAIVYEEPFSLTDFDVYIDLIGTFSGDAIVRDTIDFSSRDAVDPEIAGLPGDNLLLCVFTDRVDGGDNPIRGRLFDTVALGNVAGAFEIANTNVGGTTTWTNARPDVGGIRTSGSGGQFLVVWERAFSTGGTAARRATVDAAGTVGIALGLKAFNANERHEWVRVSESNGATNAWNIAFVNNDLTTSDETIWAGQLNTDGSTLNAAEEVYDGGVLEAIEELDVSDAIAIDGLTPTYLVVYDDFNSVDRDVNALICRGADLVNTVDVNLYEHAPPGDEDAPRLATTADEFIVAYTRIDPGNSTTVVTTMDLVEGNQLAISERRFQHAPSSFAQGGTPAVASRYAGGFTSSRFVGVAWDTFDGATGENRAQGVTHAADNEPSPAFQFCDGTVNSTGDRGFMRLEGTRSASTSKTVVGEAIPPNQFCLLVAGSGMGNMPALGGGEGTLCLGGTLGRYNDQLAAANAQGVVNFTIDPANIPAGGAFVTAVPGTIYQWQIWHRDVAGAGPTSNLTNAVTIFFD